MSSNIWPCCLWHQNYIHTLGAETNWVSLTIFSCCFLHLGYKYKCFLHLSFVCLCYCLCDELSVKGHWDSKQIALVLKLKAFLCCCKNLSIKKDSFFFLRSGFGRLIHYFVLLVSSQKPGNLILVCHFAFLFLPLHCLTKTVILCHRAVNLPSEFRVFGT